MYVDVIVLYLDDIFIGLVDMIFLFVVLDVIILIVGKLLYILILVFGRWMLFLMWYCLKVSI